MADAADKAAQIANLLKGIGTASRAELKAMRLERRSRAKKPREIVTMTFSEFREFITRCAPDPDVFKILWPVVSSLFLEAERRRSKFKSSEKYKSRREQPEDCGDEPAPSTERAPVEANQRASRENPNHKGRQTAADFPDAAKLVDPPGGELAAGTTCGCGGLLREEDPTFALSFSGICPIQPESHECRHLRCNKCQQRYSTKPAKKAARERHQPSAISAVALWKYGCGFPFNRMSAMLGYYGVSLAPTTLFEMSLKGAKAVLPVFVEILKQGAQAKKMGSDDTKVVILEGDRPNEFGERTGTRTTALQCETSEGNKVAIFMTGVKHAGENLTDLLRLRIEGLAEPIHMCDGLSHNAPKAGSPSVITANCLVHARRYFFNLLDQFPEHCQYVLEMFGHVYAIDAHAKSGEMTPAQRLAVHQLESKPVLEELRSRMEDDLKEKRVEDNSGLGKAYRYMLTRWEKLTVFLRVEGAALDNNYIERQLKKAILNRKNAYFYRSDRGAQVGDIFMSLIYTCELNGVNPFEYLNLAQEHASELAACPSDWMPWTYRETLKRIRPPSQSEAMPRAS